MELKGYYNSCNIYADVVEQSALDQIKGYLDNPVSEWQNIAFMPDLHAGAGCVIGFTASLNEFIVPNLIGVDIGCGVRSVCIGKVDVDFQKLDDFIKQDIPSGKRINERHVGWDKELLNKATEVCESTNQKIEYVKNSLRSLGGGNHFIELGEDELGNKWLTVHTGSRNFGLKVAKFHQDKANKINPNGDLSWLCDKDAESYMHDMAVAQRFASENRRLILQRIIQGMGFKEESVVESVHNYIDFESGIIRKGAVSARFGELVVIPWNMRDGMIIGEGKGNPDWNHSAPHGAGRTMGRNEAKKKLTLDEFKDTMSNVWSSCVSDRTLDESPMAYKDHTQVEKYLHETVEVIYRVKTLYNFKAGE